jgi:hypothetical protein
VEKDKESSMNIVITESIRKREFGRQSLGDGILKVIIRAYTKGKRVAIKGINLPFHTRLTKVYATTIDGARRIVFLIDCETQDAFLLFYRGKNDRIGKNVSLKNVDFQKGLSKYLLLLERDLQNGAIGLLLEG